MSTINMKEIPMMLVSPFLGFVAYFISGILANIVPGNNNIALLFFWFLITSSLGALLLAVFLQMRNKIIRMVIAGVVAWLVGVILGIEAGTFLIRLPISFFDFYPAPGFGDGYCVILMGVIFGGILGGIVFGKKSILLFSFVCGIVAIPFALINETMMPGTVSSAEAWLKHTLSIFGDVDIYFLVINFAFGIGAGLSIGLYRLLSSKKNISE